MHTRFFRLMNSEPQATGGGNPDPAPTTEPATEPTANQEPTPSPDLTGDRYRKDMLKYKDENAKLRQQLDDFKVRGHKEKEDWKAVAEHHEQKAKEYESKFTGLQGALLNDKKIQSLTTEAVKQGINPASLPDLELLDFEELQVETTSNGKILVSGQDRAIAKLKTLRPHWFNNAVPSVNPSSPNVGNRPTGAVTIADLNAAEAQWKKSQSDSDKKAYFELIRKYKTQTS